VTTQKTPSPGKTPGKTPAMERSGWRAYRQEIVFLAVFLGLLAVSFSVVALKPVNDHVIEPFTGAIARVSAGVLDVLGQDVTRDGTVIESPRFAVNIRNGCNGVETMLIFLSAVLAFPAAWGARLAGLALGILAIQGVNLVRVVALFLTGVYFPSLFDSSHTVIWQSIVILCGVLLWIYWAHRFAGRPRTSPTTQEG
jgi:exosortase H (IPTLxxWG-CTERM-specific)